MSSYEAVHGILVVYGNWTIHYQSHTTNTSICAKDIHGRRSTPTLSDANKINS